MPSIFAAFARTLREQVTTQAVATFVLLVLLLRFVAGESWVTVARFLALFVALAGFGVLWETPTVDGRHLAIVSGVAVVAVTVFAPEFVVERSTSAVTAVGVLGGGWLVVDGVVAIRTDRPSSSPDSDAFDELDPGDALFEMQLFRVVAEQLRERPQTPAELAAACDLTESRVETALDRLEATGSVEPVGETADGGTRWTFVESSVGLWALLDTTLGRMGRRLLLPVRELRG